MLKKLKSRIKYILSIASCREPRLTVQTDDDRRTKTSIKHGDLIGYFIWFGPLAGIKISRTTGNQPKGDAEIQSQVEAIKLASMLKERYYIYNQLDLADLSNIEFRNVKKTTLKIAKEVALKGKHWYVTTGYIPEAVIKYFESLNIKCLQDTSQEEAIAYLQRDRELRAAKKIVDRSRRLKK